MSQAQGTPPPALSMPSLSAAQEATLAATTKEETPKMPAGLGTAQEDTALPTLPGSMTKVSSNASNGQVALTGKNKLSLGFVSLNTDFKLPDEFSLIKKMGKGAYGKVMQVLHVPSQREYACKKFEYVFSDTQRARRLLREIKILKQLQHPCCNKLLCIVPPGKCQPKETDEPLETLQFNEVFLMLRKCDMDLKKLLKSSKHLSED